jgi:uncharacterized protein (TIGR04552 family)
MQKKRKAHYESYRTPKQFSLFDLEMVRLILRGGSVLDWHLLNIPKSEIEPLLRAHSINLDEPADQVLVSRIRDESISYLRETLEFPIPQPVRKASLLTLLEMAGNSASRHRQFCACVLLKVMHTVNHFDASEARLALATADQELFKAAERRIYQTISHMMSEGLPIVEFMGGRKRRSSMVTKLFSKKSPLSAQLFDKMRFRIIVPSRADVIPIINYLARNLFPFNYVLSEESYNTLIPFADFCNSKPHLRKLLSELQLDPDMENTMNPLSSNRHSSPKYKVVHWVADMPLRVDDYQNAFQTDGINPIPRPIVYVRTELQILDRQAHRANERSDAAHNKYKARQIDTVASRLKVGLRAVANPDSTNS